MSWTKINNVKENYLDMGFMFRMVFVGKGTVHFQVLWVILGAPG